VDEVAASIVAFQASKKHMLTTELSAEK